MPSSDISICNFALSALGQKSIRSFDEDNSRARLCKNTYDMAVELVLGRLDWPFARWQEKMSMTTDIAVDDGLAAYAIPPDCITPLDVSPFGTRVYWEVRGLYIISLYNEELYLKYTRREINPSMFSSGFKGAVASKMAAVLARPLTGASAGTVANLNGQFESDLIIAMTGDANVGSEYREPDNDPDKDTFNAG